uniref:FHF complex subunit HOOK-interacting protein C-terminal domain-containing protein n=1 Tax=Mola mola TaxID=94237 RepID=A0A3Q3WMA5_MOLML
MASMVVGGTRKKSLTLRGVDPETCMIVFKNHWAQVVKILEKHEPCRSGIGVLSFLSSHGTSSISGALRIGPIPADEASAVQNYVEHMLFLLMEEEAGQGGAMGPILEFVVLEGVMERLFLWSLRRQFTEDMKLEQLRMYQMLLSQARQPLLHHKPVLRPLMMLLASCAGAGADCGGMVEAELVFLLNQLCVALVKDPSVLELFFHTSEDQGAANFLLFSLLIPYTHRQGSVGQQARDALLLIMSLSASDPRVARHIADNTYFCPVLATGLSGLYSSLPARLQVYSEDWHCLDQADWQQVPALVNFLHSLEFCSAVTKVAHPSICSQLLGYIYNGFLVPVLAPALHKLTVEEVMTTTAYLDLFLRSISEPALLQAFLSFILLHTHDNVHILDTLVSRVNTPFQLGTVSLALFRTLIGLFCEDVMLQLVFRYLIPCSHLSKKQHYSLQQRDCYSSSAASFLLLMPSWCPGNLNHPNIHLHSEHIHWPKRAELSVSDSVGYCRGSDFLMDVNYLHYLWDARQAISTSYRACRLWSAPYDGINPSPQRYRNQTGRASSALELEWDDIFFDRCTSTPAPPPLPPRHIQEMCRTATKLVHGLYVEESEFQNDVLVYDLVAQKDTKAAMLERKMAVNRQARGSITNIYRVSTTGRTVIETVNSIILPGSKVTTKDDFLSQYRELMHSLGVEPDFDEITEEISSVLFCIIIMAKKHLYISDFCQTLCNFCNECVISCDAIGPFISVLLSRLENLLENSIAVNLLVTGILAQLGSYPQPLLRSFLLNTDACTQPNVRTLYQVLASVHAQIERYVAARPDYPALVTQAWRFLLAKDQDSKKTNKLILQSKIHLPSQVFAIILYAEFLKELAAIAQEHSIALDCSAEE